MEFRVLGPLELAVDGRRVEITAAKQRSLLAILLIRANETVSTDRLVEDLWAGRAPKTAGNTLQVHVSQLRKALVCSGESPLLTRSRGYALRVDLDSLDSHRFVGLLREGAQLRATGDTETAARVLREALALWRGPPFADFAFEPFAQHEIRRLEELRVDAVEERVAADLELGRHRTLVTELETLVEQQPFREGLCGHLMLALYRSGRQAEALDVFRGLRTALVDELGLEPGPALQDLARKILNHDASLLSARTDPDEAARIRDTLELGRRRVLAEMTGAPELHEARDAALALGDPETAAEAESWVGQLAWVRGDQAGCLAHLGRALALLEHRPASRSKASVLDLLARRRMTAAEYDQAVGYAREALSISTDLGDDEARAENLTTIGTALAFGGDPGGIANLDEAVAVARLHDLARPLARACLNLAVVLESYGEDMSRLPELEGEGRLAAERAGDAPLLGAFKAREPFAAFREGRWDDALLLCDEFISMAERLPHYEERLPRMIRAAIRNARGDVDAASRDARRAIQLCRAVRDPQALYATLGWAAAIFDEEVPGGGRPCAEEALDLWLKTGLAFPPTAWILAPAFVLAGSAPLSATLSAARVSTRWLEAAKAMAVEDWSRAADLVATTGMRSSEADLRLRAARALLADGRHREADTQLDSALAFYRSVRATLPLERAEELLLVANSHRPPTRLGVLR